MKKITVLSLFDGMACGHIAMQQAGLEVERYDAYEIDKYAVKVASHNFPDIQQHGDVFAADFTQYNGVDFVIGGSPCTYWSIAQKNNRETEASGLGWELFSQYVRAIKEAKPKFFIYENNKSMSKQIRASIDETFGFEAIGINSALVSAQNRQRLYWVGKRNEEGTYSKVHVEQPEDRGILLRDILESSTSEKTYCMVEPVSVRLRGRDCGAKYEARDDGKGGTVTSERIVEVAEPVGTTTDGKSYCLTAGYSKGSGKKIGNYAAHTLTKGCKSMVAEPVKCLSDREVDYMFRKEGRTEYGYIQNTNRNKAQCITANISNGKGVTQSAGGGGMGGKTGLYAVPAEYNSKPVYEVRNGLITIKGKQYPIKLEDGFYIIRKLTVRECMRLQTVPEWYDLSVISNSQAYKCLGNGWTVEVIAHLIRSTMTAQSEVRIEQLLLF